jgi:ABC-2 type transport system permease protein
MRSLMAPLWTEYIKIRRSRILWITILIFLFIPFMMGLLMFVQKYPEISGKLGLIGTKASMLKFGKADWPTYMGLLTQGIAGIGLMGFGFVTSWVFGREFSDHTVKDILALPVPRSFMVLSKFVVIVIWSALLSFIFFVFAIIIGKIIQLSGWSGEMVFHSAYSFTITSVLTLSLCTPVAFFASFSRGYLLPIGFLILTLIIANFTGLVGIGPYFPWSIPGLYSAPAGTEDIHLGIISYIILFLTSVSGFAGTIAWWRFADQR